MENPLTIPEAFASIVAGLLVLRFILSVTSINKPVSDFNDEVDKSYSYEVQARLGAYMQLQGRDWN